MKRAIMGLLALGGCLLFTKAETFEVNGIWFEQMTEQEVMVVPEPSSSSGSGTSFDIRNYYEGDILIPQNVVYQDIEYTVTAVKEATFSDSRKLTSVSIPATIRNLGDAPFANCPQLSTITLSPDNADYSLVDGLLYNKSVTTLIACPGAFTQPVTLPSSVSTIATSAFCGCANLTEISIPHSVTAIGKHAFEGCKSLTALFLPQGITAIPDSAFYYCSSLKEMMLPESVTSIGKRAFYQCNKISSIVLPDVVETIDDYAFGLCSGLSSLQLSSSLKTIGYRAFENCSKLKRMDIPAQVSEIGVWAFVGCSGLTTIKVDERNLSFSSLDGVLYDKERKTLRCYPCAKQGDFTMPASVTTIGEYGFYACRYLRSLVLSASLTTIKEGAFRLCSSLQRITLPAGLQSWGENVFVACSALQAIVYYADTPPEISASTFTSSNYNVPLYVLNRAIDDYKNAPCWSQFATILAIDGTVVDGLLGDVNNDGSINMTDVTIVINYILGKEVSDFNWQVGDMNFDGFINMSDVTCIISLILGKTVED